MIILSSQIDNDITNMPLCEKGKITLKKGYKEFFKDLNLAHSLDTIKGETHFTWKCVIRT